MASSAAEAYQRYHATSHFAAFDGLRAVAIAAVVFHHATPRPLSGWLGRGHLGVQLFFALSGFLITSLLLREWRATGRLALVAFWVRRSLRLFPLYYAVLALFCLVAALAAASPARSHFFASLPFFASYTGNWAVDYGVSHPVWFGFSWSLATEQQFYWVWPPLLAACLWFGRVRSGQREHLGVLLACAVLALLVVVDQCAERRWFATWVSPRGLLQQMVTSFTASIAFGALLALLLTLPQAFQLLRRMLGSRFSVPLLALWLAVWVVWPPRAFVLFEAGLSLLVAACALGPGHAVGRLVATGPLVALGRVSYGVYLFHVPVLGGLRRALPALVERPWLLFPCALALSFAAAWLSFRYFEAPFTALGSRFRARRAVGSEAFGVAALPACARDSG